MDLNFGQFSCCELFERIDWSRAEMPKHFILFNAVNFEDLNVYYSLCAIIYCPLFWNIVARYEYRTKKISKLLRYPKLAVCILAFSIVTNGLIRDHLFVNALKSQPSWYILQENWSLFLGYVLNIFGLTLVLTSFYKLGFYGTFLGDYFGILLQKRVTGFPFNVFEHPMYYGATAIFFGYSFIYASQAGLLLSVFVSIVYYFAIIFEGPFTDEIYRKAKAS